MSGDAMAKDVVLRPLNDDCGG